MVKPEFAAAGTELDVTVLGKKLRAVVVAESPFDGENMRLKG
jgi:dimethylglycine dehydrogenase